MVSRTLFSTRALRALVLALSIVVGALGCREDPTAPIGQEPEAVLATATTALAFYQVSAGDYHSCAVTTDNRAYCWGFNGNGQLGDGTTTDRHTPVAVAGGLRFHAISTGYGSTCGVTTDYRAYCWGDNVLGHLGDGTTTRRLTPVAVVGGHRFRQVDVYSEHACAVSYPDPGRAYCWGWGGQGQLGNGSTANHSTPVPVSGSLVMRQVSVGSFHSCGVTTSNVAYCWGGNRQGQLGDSSSVTQRSTPSRVAGAHQFRMLDAGANHTCAVTTGNRAFCWGDGRGGALGNGKAYLSFWPRAVAGGLSFERVSAGLYRSCGETTTNRPYCWGEMNHLTPVAVPGNFYFNQVSAGGTHTCGKTPASAVYCWGGNFSGELGDGTTTASSTPVRVVGAM
jgi:alpha-tubulin suppressor-like RCC1 family protein